MIFKVDSAKKEAIEAKIAENKTRTELEPLRKYEKIRDVERAEKLLHGGFLGEWQNY